MKTSTKEVIDNLIGLIQEVHDNRIFVAAHDPHDPKECKYCVAVMEAERHIRNEQSLGAMIQRDKRNAAYALVTVSGGVAECPIVKGNVEVDILDFDNLADASNRVSFSDLSDREQQYLLENDPEFADKLKQIPPTEAVMSTRNREYTITCTATINVPPSAVEVRAFDGWIIGFKLPNGSQIMPWVTFEHQDGDTYRDLNARELEKLGFDNLEPGDRCLEEL
jgi:hypothetical protein